MKARVWVLAVALVLGACAQPGRGPLYQWEGYQGALYEHLRAQGGDPAAQLSKLVAQLQKNAAQGRASPPGMRAHIALLYARMGDDVAARQTLAEERRAFPESAPFIDFLLKQAVASAPERP